MLADTPVTLDTLMSYVPSGVARNFIDKVDAPSEPSVERSKAALLFADISGFTELTERLAQQGPAGEEYLTQLLNDYFGELIDIIVANGGEVVKFAGDALLALWPATQSMSDDKLPTATLRAAQCGLAVQNKLHEYDVAEGVRLSMRVVVAAGDIQMARLGGVFGRWEFLVSGKPLDRMAIMQNLTEPGQVALSPEAWAFVKARCSGVELDGCVRLTNVDDKMEARRLKPIIADDSMSDALRAYIPGAVIYRLDAGQADWLAELRSVTVLFINLPDLGYRTPLDRGQEIMFRLQTALYRFEGSINKLNVDDKGSTLVAALGLPPLAHEDDAVRAVRAALAMRHELEEMGLRSSIGVASGRAFCGVVGNNLRREYTMIGDVVNLAARLMQATDDDVLCDEITYQSTQARIAYDTLPKVKVKGKAESVAVFRPKGEAKTAIRPQSEIIGREAERAILAEASQELLRGSPGKVIVIEGQAGIGKSRLVEELRKQASSLSLTAFDGSGDAVERSTPYHAWRSIFAQLLDLQLMTNLQDRRKHVLDLLAIEPDMQAHAPLLNAVLPLELPDTEETAQMTGLERARNTRNFLVKLLQASVVRSPKVLILDDGHWLDSASWELAHEVAERIHPLLLIIATRPIPKPLPLEYRSILQHSNITHIKLNALSSADSLALASQRLGTTTLPDSVAALIQKKAEGHPYFSEELAYALRDSNLITVENGECHLAPDVGDLSKLKIPSSIQGIVTSRIDRLHPDLQMTLRTASVIGRVFSHNILRDIYPIEGQRKDLHKHLDTLARLDITPRKTPDPEISYTFKHAITQEAVYNLMTFAQRRQLHRQVAEWYERTHAEDMESLESHYSLLAHHWSRAEEYVEAVDYLEKAGDQAMHSGANAEAMTFFEQAFDALSHLTTSADYKKVLIDVAIKYSRVSVYKLSKNVPIMLERALEAAHSLEDETRQAYVLSSTAAFYYATGQMGQAFEYFAKCMGLAEKLDLEELLLLPYNLLGRANVISGQYAVADDLLTKGIALAEKMDDRELLSGSLAFFAGSHWFQGKPAQGIPFAERSMQLAEELGHPSRIAGNLMVIGSYHCLCGHLDEAQELFERCLKIAEETEDLHPLYFSHGFLGYLALQHGETKQAIAHLDRSLQAAQESNAMVYVPLFQSYRAEADLKAGKRKKALAGANKALEMAELTQQHTVKGVIENMLGRIYASSSKPDTQKSEQYLKQSIDTHQQVGGTPFVAISQIELAKLYQAQDMPERARELIEKAEATFEQLNMAWYLEQAHQTKAQL